MLTNTAQQAIEKQISYFLSKDKAKSQQALVLRQMLSGGKRIRPALAVLSCQALGGKLAEVLPVASALEILHNYTLIVDDVIDHSLTRRNLPTVWAKYGKSIADCVAMDYAASIFQAAVEFKKPKSAVNVLAKTLKTIVEGEILDILFEIKGREEEPYIKQNRYKKISLKNYLQMVSKKTACLLQASCYLGGLSANGKPEQLKALSEFGFNIGIAFQIQDDILDIFGDEKKFGKKIGKDIEERKAGNLVLLLAFSEIAKKDISQIRRVMLKDKILAKDIKEIIKLVKTTQAKEKAQKMAQKYVAKAKQALQTLLQNKYTERLSQLADFIIQREK